MSQNRTGPVDVSVRGDIRAHHHRARKPELLATGQRHALERFASLGRVWHSMQAAIVNRYSPYFTLLE
jgi:hypothetical protein